MLALVLALLAALALPGDAPADAVGPSATGASETVAVGDECCADDAAQAPCPPDEPCAPGGGCCACASCGSRVATPPPSAASRADVPRAEHRGAPDVGAGTDGAGGVCPPPRG